MSMGVSGMRRWVWLMLFVFAGAIGGCQGTPLQLAPSPPPPDPVASDVATPVEPANPVMEFCRTLERRTPEMRQRLIGEISTVVQQAGSPAAILSQLSAGLGPGFVDLRQADADGDGLDDLLIAWAHCDLPIMVYRHAAPDHPVLLPSDNVGFGNPLAGNRFDQVSDVNGDGHPEVVASYTVPGGSATTEVPYIWQWRTDHFATLFTASVTSWRGRNRWEAEVGSVTIQCRPMGPFQHKLSPHRQLSEVFRWDPGRGAYVLAERTWEPVTVQLQQIDVAERLFYAGQYEGARWAYQEVERYPADRMDSVAWVPFSRWRIAQIDAMLERKEEALAAFQRGAAEPYPLGDLAQIFLGAYVQTDAAGGFAAVWEYLRKEANPYKWTYLFDAPNIAARPVLEDAFRRAGRVLPTVLPEEPHLDPADCMQSHS